MTRAVLRRIHRWIGLLLALPLLLQAATGLIMVVDPFEAAVQGVTSAGVPLTAPDDLRNVDVESIVANARDAAAENLAPRRWRVLPGDLVAVDFASPGRPAALEQVVVDAASHGVIAVRQNPDAVYRWVHSVHETLLMGLAGRRIVGWIGVLLLVLAVTGIPLWWPPRGRIKAGFTVTRAAKGWRFHRELHGAAGAWVLALLLLQSVSGMALAFPKTAKALADFATLTQGQRAQSQNEQHQLDGRSDSRRPSAEAIPLDPTLLIAAALAAAQRAMPDAILEDLRLPAGPGRPITAILLPAGYRQGTPRAVVRMDPLTAQVLSTQDPRTQSFGAAVLDWMRALHEGAALGPGWRVVMTLFALALPLFPITGVMMWSLRQRVRRGTQQRAAAWPKAVE